MQTFISHFIISVSISTMTAGSVAPVWAEAAQTEAAKAEDTAEAELEDGVYGVEFDTDSGHVPCK